MGDPLIKLIGNLDDDESTGWVKVPANGKSTITLEGTFDGATVVIEGAVSMAPPVVLSLGDDAIFTAPSAKTLSLAPGLFIRATMSDAGGSSDVEVKSFAFLDRS